MVDFLTEPVQLSRGLPYMSVLHWPTVAAKADNEDCLEALRDWPIAQWLPCLAEQRHNVVKWPPGKSFF